MTNQIEVMRNSYNRKWADKKQLKTILMNKTGISFFFWPLTWLLIKISLTRPSRNCNPRFWFDHVYMIGGVTRHKLPHLSGVPRLRVNRPKWYKAFITYSVALNLCFFSFFHDPQKVPLLKENTFGNSKLYRSYCWSIFFSSFNNKTRKFCNSDWTWLPETYNLQLPAKYIIIHRTAILCSRKLCLNVVGSEMSSRVLSFVFS